ncbi:MAG TPA: glycosyltransferase [Terriglobia bacterium]|nr:glycosyltransferase [Terriglobia bacterium]
MLKKVAKLVFLLVAPLVLALLGVVFLLQDWATLLMKTLRRPPASAENPPLPAAGPSRLAASVVIPNWNGKHLLERHLPSVIADCGPEDEIIVVDNASTDGSAAFVRQRFPQVRLLELERNRGFGGGCNAGARAARHPVVVLLNNDMRVVPGFLAALLSGFTDANVFAVSAQIFFSDPLRRREETGLTFGWFSKGFFRVRHDAGEGIRKPYPTFYAGGGSSAYDRRKFLELGGFDPLFEPFYLEDTDLSYNAWRRGWKVLYQPEARVYHEHRGTIGRHFTPQSIQAFLQKNYVLMVWKNLHQPLWMWSHLLHLYGHMLLHGLGRPTETRTSIGAFLLAARQLPQALRARRAALRSARLSNPAVFARLRPAVFRDAFLATEAAGGQLRPSPAIHVPAAPRPAAPSAPSATSTDAPLNILFVSPYSIYPAVHGGAVLMLQAIRELSKRNRVFVLSFVDSAGEAESNRALEQWAQSAEMVIRRHRPSHPFHLRSHAEQAFSDPEFSERLSKMVYLHDIDLIQFEYTQLAQYHLPLRAIPQCLFEHDIYFRSVGRQLCTGNGGWVWKSKQLLEWLRGLRFEVAAASRFDAVFTCHEQEQRLLESLLGNGRPWILPGLRTAIDASSYRFPGGPRQKNSLLFVGNFQHRPNADGLAYFCEAIFPAIRQRRPETVLHVAGAAASEDDRQRFAGEGIRFLGQVPDIRDALGRYSVFICPIRVGAGVRVKILEAFASGIPVVSTSLGAEGLAVRSGQEIVLADSPADFAEACLRLLDQPAWAELLAANARRLVESRYDWSVVLQRLEATYRELVRRKRGAIPAPGIPQQPLTLAAGVDRR